MEHELVLKMHEEASALLEERGRWHTLSEAVLAQQQALPRGPSTLLSCRVLIVTSYLQKCGFEMSLRMCIGERPSQHSMAMNLPLFAKDCSNAFIYSNNHAAEGSQKGGVAPGIC